MKRLVTLVLALALAFSLCACSTAQIKTEEPTEKNPLGYIIVNHWDGDEHIEFCSYYVNSISGLIVITTMDNHCIASNAITLFFY